MFLFNGNILCVYITIAMESKIHVAQIVYGNFQESMLCGNSSLEQTFIPAFWYLIHKPFYVTVKWYHIGKLNMYLKHPAYRKTGSEQGV